MRPTRVASAPAAGAPGGPVRRGPARRRAVGRGAASSTAVQPHFRVARDDVLGQRPHQVMHALAPILRGAAPIPARCRTRRVRHAALRAQVHNKGDARPARRGRAPRNHAGIRMGLAGRRRRRAAFFPARPAARREPATRYPPRSRRRDRPRVRSARRCGSAAARPTRPSSAAPRRSRERRRPSGESRWSSVRAPGRHGIALSTSAPLRRQVERPATGVPGRRWPWCSSRYAAAAPARRRAAVGGGSSGCHCLAPGRSEGPGPGR